LKKGITKVIPSAVLLQPGEGKRENSSTNCPALGFSEVVILAAQATELC